MVDSRLLGFGVDVYSSFVHSSDATMFMTVDTFSDKEKKIQNPNQNNRARTEFNEHCSQLRTLNSR